MHFIKTDNKYNISKKNGKDWLSKQETCTLFRPARRKFNRAKVLSFYTNFLWDADSANMKQYEENNDGYGYFSVMIEIFTRYIYTYPLKTLKGDEMVTAINRGFKVHKEKPINFRSDKGSEYKNIKSKRFLEREQVNHILTNYET